MRSLHILICLPLTLLMTFAFAQSKPAQVNVLVSDFSGSLIEGEEIWFKSVITKKIYKGDFQAAGQIAISLLPSSVIVNKFPQIFCFIDITAFKIIVALY